MASKTDALSTFLTESQARTDKMASPSPDDDPALAGKVVVLLILAKQSGPMPLEQLKTRCEISSPDEFDRVLGYLGQMGWIETRDTGLALTERGREAAEQERQRLLRFG